jgi:hypothetical protein
MWLIVNSLRQVGVKAVLQISELDGSKWRGRADPGAILGTVLPLSGKELEEDAGWVTVPLWT